MTYLYKPTLQESKKQSMLYIHPSFLNMCSKDSQNFYILSKENKKPFSRVQPHLSRATVMTTLFLWDKVEIIFESLCTRRNMKDGIVRKAKLGLQNGEKCVTHLYLVCVLLHSVLWSRSFEPFPADFAFSARILWNSRRYQLNRKSHFESLLVLLMASRC